MTDFYEDTCYLSNSEAEPDSESEDVATSEQQPPLPASVDGQTTWDDPQALLNTWLGELDNLNMVSQLFSFFFFLFFLSLFRRHGAYWERQGEEGWRVYLFVHRSAIFANVVALSSADVHNAPNDQRKWRRRRLDSPTSRLFTLAHQVDETGPSFFKSNLGLERDTFLSIRCGHPPHHFCTDY